MEKCSVDDYVLLFGREGLRIGALHAMAGAAHRHVSEQRDIVRHQEPVLETRARVAREPRMECGVYLLLIRGPHCHMPRVARLADHQFRHTLC